MQTMQSSKPFPGADVRAASRQLWLAGLGAAVVTRDWTRKEAGQVFRTLVREGAVVESRAVRYVDDRFLPSFAQANVVLRRTRATLRSAAASYASSALALVRTSLPRVLPTLTLAPARRAAAPASSRRKATSGTTRGAKTVRRGKAATTAKTSHKRTTGRAAKRASIR